MEMTAERGDREPQALADPGGARDPRPPPSRFNFFHFHAFFLTEILSDNPGSATNGWFSFSYVR